LSFSKKREEGKCTTSSLLFSVAFACLS
jgi:hypothetical protein